MTSVSEAVRSENPVKLVVTDSDEQRLNDCGFAAQYEGTYSIRPDECSSVTFVATKLVAYNANQDVCTWCARSQDSVFGPNQDKRQKAWRSIPRISPEVKPSSGTLYVIDANITRGSGESYYEGWLSDIAMVYLQQHTVLVLNLAMVTDMSRNISEEAKPWLEIVSSLLETFGHDFAERLGTQTGCYVDSWPLAPSSSPLPEGGLG